MDIFILQIHKVYYHFEIKLFNNYFYTILGSCVHKFTLDGIYVKRFGSETSPAFPQPLSSPRGITAFPDARHLLIADSHNDRLVLFDENGEFQQLITSGIEYPESLAVNKSGNVFVAMTDRIGVFAQRK
jgi:DNA-binding beta-propeller fold protein YncE